jgi:hypothetical protein
MPHIRQFPHGEKRHDRAGGGQSTRVPGFFGDRACKDRPPEPVTSRSGGAHGTPGASTVGLMFNIESNLTNNFEGVEQYVVDQMHEAMAQGLADKMRELNRDNANDVELDLQTDTDNPQYQIDGERVRKRANEILAG